MEEVDFEVDEETVTRTSAPVGATTAAASESAGGHRNAKRGGKIKTKGRGHDAGDDEGRYDGRGGTYESLDHGHGSGPLKSVEGWIVFVSNVHGEAQEEDVLDKFSECGEVKNIHLNLDRRTGYVKGYALIEYATKQEATQTIQTLNGKELMGQALNVDWAFVKR